MQHSGEKRISRTETACELRSFQESPKVYSRVGPHGFVQYDAAKLSIEVIINVQTMGLNLTCSKISIHC